MYKYEVSTSWDLGLLQSPNGGSIPVNPIMGAGILALGVSKLKPLSCEDRVQKIAELMYEIQTKTQEYLNPKFWIPLDGKPAKGFERFGTREGHIQQINDKKAALQNALDNYPEECGGPSGSAGLPKGVYATLFSPTPAKTPSPAGLPYPPRKPFRAKKYIIGGGIVVGAGVVVFLAPEVLLLAPEGLGALESLLTVEDGALLAW